MGERRPDVTVLGAGVIGLTTAVCLAEQGFAGADPHSRSSVSDDLCGGLGDDRTQLRARR